MPMSTSSPDPSLGEVLPTVVDANAGNNFTAEEIYQFLEILHHRKGSADQIQYADRVFHQLKQAPECHQYADVFLSSDDTTARFYGATLYEAQSTVDFENSNVTLQKLIDWYVELVNQQDRNLIIVKICRALVGFRLKPSSIWEQSVEDLCHRLYLASSTSRVEEAVPLAWIVKNLQVHQSQAVLWFLTVLTEEASKKGPSDAQSLAIDQSIVDEITAIEILLQSNATPLLKPSNGLPLAGYLMDAFRACCDWAHTHPNDRGRLIAFQAFIPTLLDCLDIQHVDTGAFETFEDLLERFPSMFSQQHLNMIAAKLVSPGTSVFLTHVQDASHTDQTLAVVGFLAAYGDIAVHHIVRAPDSIYQGVGDLMLEIMHCPGYPTLTDMLSPRLLPTWMAYVEYVQQAAYDSSEEQNVDTTGAARQRLIGLIHVCLSKARWPSDPWSSLTHDERIQFKANRSEIAELFQATYVVFGLDLFEKFTNHAISLCNEHNWPDLEVALFAINSLAETSALSDEGIHALLLDLFSSSIFEDFGAHCEFLDHNTKQARLRIIFNYSSFFASRPQFLPGLLDSLFAATQETQTSINAAKCIKRITGLCRTLLVHDLDKVVQSWKDIFTSSTIKTKIKEDLTNAVAVIIQALSTPYEQISPLMDVIEFMENKFHTGLKDLSTNQDRAMLKVSEVLHCLVQLGLGLQEPDDISTVQAGPPQEPFFWTEGPGQRLQQSLLSMVELAMRAFPICAVMIECICRMFRAGYGENTPGLFVFPPASTRHLVLATTIQTPNLGYVFETAATMLGKLPATEVSSAQGLAYDILKQAGTIVASPDPHARDPDLCASVLNMAAKSIPNFLQAFFAAQADTSSLLQLSITGLRASETSYKQAAAHFWATMFQRYELPENLSNALDMCLDNFCEQVCEALMFQIGGIERRENLDMLAEPVKKLVFHRPMMAKERLLEALNGPNFPSQKVSGKEKRFWVEKVMKLRGARATNVAVKDFWSQCQ